MPVSAMASLMRLNTRLFTNCLVDVSDEQAAVRPNQATNNLAFIGCHLVDARHFMAAQLGLDQANPIGERLKNVQHIDEMTEYPAVTEIRDAWHSLAPTLEACVNGLSRDDLRAPSKARFPVDDPSVAGMVAFLIQHESYHIGQMALLRKYIGHPAMSYS